MASPFDLLRPANLLRPASLVRLASLLHLTGSAYIRRSEKPLGALPSVRRSSLLLALVLLISAVGARVSPAQDSLDIVAVVDDVPGSPLGSTEDLRPMKDQLETIRAVLTAEGKLELRGDAIPNRIGDC